MLHWKCEKLIIWLSLSHYLTFCARQTYSIETHLHIARQITDNERFIQILKGSMQRKRASSK